MDWLAFAEMDFKIYQDPERIKQYVAKEKITAEEFHQVTGVVYEATP